ncbi:MAG TPA: LysM peptidoglycan-binding domain-containing protein [Anaerolineales bacterium]|nr:LysM peptidoglycan-binding domain-containing protein [Anaerolineales bacterium]
MSRKNRSIFFTSIMLLGAVFISACQQPYSTPPAVTNTPLANSLFSTPLPGEPNSMDDVQNFITQTALAASGGVIPSSTPGASTDGAPTVTPTSVIVIPPTSTQAVSSGVTQAAASPVPSSGSWTLRTEEFPFCIARRYNVDPNDLIKASGLTTPDIYYEGLKLVIPQNSTWNEANLGPRGLRTRPGTYSVTGNADTTVYGVACKYGDVDPAAIAQNNGISVDATLTVGQTLNIP